MNDQARESEMQRETPSRTLLPRQANGGLCIGRRFKLGNTTHAPLGTGPRLRPSRASYTQQER